MQLEDYGIWFKGFKYSSKQFYFKPLTFKALTAKEFFSSALYGLAVINHGDVILEIKKIVSEMDKQYPRKTIVIRSYPFFGSYAAIKFLMDANDNDKLLEQICKKIYVKDPVFFHYINQMLIELELLK